MEVIIDTREKEQYFREYVAMFPDITFKRQKLDQGDIQSEHVLVERKTLDDLYDSIVAQKTSVTGSKLPNRMASEVDRLSSVSGKIIVFLIVGSIKVFMQPLKTRSGSIITRDPVIIYDMLASLMARDFFHVMWAPNEMDGRISMIKFMLAVEAGKYGVPARRNPDNLIARMLKITPVQWSHLKNKHNTLSNISILKPSDLTFVHGIGHTKAEFILSFLNRKIE